MKEIKKLIEIVLSCSQAETGLLDVPKQSIKEKKFIQGIELGHYTSDEQAAKDLYNTNPNDVRYKMLKHRVKKKLFNELNYVNPQKVTANHVRQKEIQCNSLIYQANIVRARYEFDLVINLATKALMIAQEFDFTDLKVSALELLSLSYSEQGFIKKFTAAQEELKAAMRHFVMEREAVSMFQHATVQLRKSTKTRKEFLPQLPGIIEKLEKLWKGSGTFSSYYAYYRTYIWYHELEGNFKEIIAITVDALRLVDHNKINVQRFDLTYNNFIMVYAHLRAKDYTDGLAYAEKNLLLYNPTSVNWFSYMENYFLLAVHAQHYELGDILQRKIFDNSSFHIIPTIAKERWILYRSYFRLVYSQATVPEGEANNPYLLSLPEYSKDKLGFNVAILTLQFIYLLEKGETEALLYRIESIKKYVSTHLKDAFSLRSKLFLKLLVLTVTEDYDAEACRTKGESLYKKLLDTPAPGDAYAEIEIVPYEHLWDLILQILAKEEASTKARTR
ncbi:hypothetical protein [Pontibacter amylolyticus]|uniref:Tetratricopeptide repeat protein n=1 Tax=Pontibacter amylolyticus TaxID=1424080 RepID=A0ABQ1VY97_9BACT|nr:hypothetical protein [Pontibacter amylolyticus]GGG02086.1 hypothetical protein GCM10011323_03620 [Pontibacter amylolyticus]